MYEVKANCTFRAFFLIASVGRSRFIEIQEGAVGLLDEKDENTGRYKTVSFAYGKNDTATAPVDYNFVFQKTAVVHHTLLENVPRFV